MFRKLFAGVLGAAVALTACADEDPLDIGGELVSGGVIRTFEVVLDADEFLAGDTAISGFAGPAGAGFLLVADQFADTLDAHGLLRYGPLVAVYRDAQGTAQSDSMPELVSVRLQARVDSIAGERAGPVELRLFGTQEAWDAASATWELRVDTAGDRRSWTEPGGGTTRLLAAATLGADADSVIFDVDSAALDHFSDTTATGRGLLIAAATPGTRLQLTSLTLSFEARPTARPDTVATGTLVPTAGTFIFEPSPDPTGTLRVGGIPSWRSFLAFRQDLRDRVVSCPAPASCAAALRDVELNRAELVLTPLEVPAAFEPLDTMVLDAREVLRSPLVPLARSPLGGRAGSPLTPFAFAAPSLFDAPGGETVAVPVTAFVRALLQPSTEGGPDPSDMLALFARPENLLFGFSGFGSEADTDRAPRLRLILTLAGEGVVR